MLRRKADLISVLLIVTLLSVYSTKTYASTIVKRLSGANRYATSTSVALDGWQQSDYAILASGENFPDALSAAPLAKKYDAPIILTQKDSLPLDTIDALQQLKVKSIFIIGGTGVISTAVQNKINSMGITTTRLSGKDRYETAIKVAELLDNVSEIAVVTGEDFSDALSVSPIAVKRNMPIILIGNNTIPEGVKAYINSHDIVKTYVIGDGSSLDDANLALLPNVEKISGEDKYKRNLAVIDSFKSELDFNAIYITSGEDFPDGLSGSILAGRNSNPMFLVGNDSSSQKKYLEEDSSTLDTMKVLGGAGVVRDEVIDNLVDVSSVADSSTQLSVTDIAKNANAIVKVEVKDSSNKVISTGSGCIISSDGKLITSYDVINGAYFADVILSNGTKYEVDGVLGYNKGKDIAILKLKNARDLPITQLENSDTLQLGNQIVTIGSPSGIQNNVSTGIVSGLNRINSREGKDVQISTTISKGSSGGALFDMYGKLIGITYFGTESTNDFNYAIPINEVKSLISAETLTNLSQLASTTVPISTSFLPHLSDVPAPENANLHKVSVSSDGKDISYYYVISAVRNNFMELYFKLLVDSGWKLSETTTDSSGKQITIFKKGDNKTSIGFSGYDIYITGNIH